MNNFANKHWNPDTQIALVDKYIRQKIQTIRKEKNTSQAELGQILGISSQQIHNYETGLEPLIPCSTLALISQFFDVPIQDFFPKNAFYCPVQRLEQILRAERTLDSNPSKAKKKKQSFNC